MQVLQATADLPVLIHCTKGTHRTGDCRGHPLFRVFSAARERCDPCAAVSCHVGGTANTLTHVPARVCRGMFAEAGAVVCKLVCCFPCVSPRASLKW